VEGALRSELASPLRDEVKKSEDKLLKAYKISLPERNKVLNKL
jgi:hypothetical protein